MEGAGAGLGAAFAAGVLSFLSPCVLPLVPVLIAFISGVSYEALAAAPGTAALPSGAGGRSPAALPASAVGRSVRWLSFLHVFVFVLGFTAVFVLLGASATALGQALFDYQKWFMRIGGALVVLFGLFMMGLLPVNLLQKDFRVHWRQKPAGFAGSFLVGATFGFGWTPCVGPILGSILLLASSAESLGQGMLLLSVYSLGLALPFLAAALLFDRFLAAFRRFRGALGWVEKIAGAFLVLVGILVATGQFTRLTGWMLDAFDPWMQWLMEKGI